MTPATFQKRLLTWFDTYGRTSLPWQQNKTPYRVFVSEIMLQQTQVKTVIPYFEKFMQRFPTLPVLAEANEDDVLHAWAGLGYYSRARNLHRAAKKVMTEFKGCFPDNVLALQTLPGIGPSTAGAITAIAFEKLATILDGNVKRVLSRIHGITDPINDKTVEDNLWKIATRYTPLKRVADYTQAIMDLGATFCTRSQPQCPGCPFKNDCKAHQLNLVDLIPGKKAAKQLPVKQATFLLLKHAGTVLLQKRPARGIWGGLYSLPEISGPPDKAAIKTFCTTRLRSSIRDYETLPSFRHTFSHYHLDIHPVLIEIKTKSLRMMEGEQELWYNLQQPTQVGLPKPVQQLLSELK